MLQLLKAPFSSWVWEMYDALMCECCFWRKSIDFGEMLEIRRYRRVNLEEFFWETEPEVRKWRV